MLLDNIDYKVYRQVQCFSYQNSLVETIKSETTTVWDKSQINLSIAKEKRSYNREGGL